MALTKALRGKKRKLLFVLLAVVAVRYLRRRRRSAKSVPAETSPAETA